MARSALLAALLTVMPVAAKADIQQTPGGPLNGKQIRAMVGGKKIYLATPLGSELPISYGRDGTVYGNGESIGLARFLPQAKDTGKWWIEGDKLCQKWQNWHNQAQHCYELQMQGKAKVVWRRSDGTTGIARLEQ